MKTSFNGIWPLIEDPKISKIEYLSKDWSGMPQILTISSGDQTRIEEEKDAWNEDDIKWKMASNVRWP